MNRPIKILIDGYNLLFQSNLMGKGRGPSWLLKARRRLASTLQQNLSTEELSATHIVFDAHTKHAPEDAAAYPSGPHFLFALEHPEADDLLEELIRSHAHPKTLLVVSSDNRVLRCAKARKCRTMRSAEYLAYLESPQRSQADNQVEANEERAEQSVSDQEVSYWMQEFDLEDD